MTMLNAHLIIEYTWAEGRKSVSHGLRKQKKWNGEQRMDQCHIIRQIIIFRKYSS